MLVVKPVPEQIIGLRGLGRPLAQIEGSEPFLLPEVHRGDADHGETVADVVYIDTVSRDRRYLSVPGVPVLDPAVQEPLSRIQKDPGSDQHKSQQNAENEDLQDRSYSYRICCRL